MENEDDIMKKQEEDISKISNFKNKNERLSWKRKHEKLQEIITNEIEPLQEQILSLMDKKTVALDAIDDLRKQMVRECIHPKDYLIHKTFYIECKFCSAKLSLPK